MGYLIILAKQAFERAIGKKHRSRAVVPRNGRLLAVVGEYARNNELAGRPAKPFFSLQPIDPASTGTQFAHRGNSVRLLDAFVPFNRGKE